MEEACKLISNPIFGMFFGAIITWVVAHIYYAAASRDLLKEAKELRELNIITLRALEAGGIYQLTRDESGKITGLKHNLQSNIVSSPSHISASAEIK